MKFYFIVEDHYGQYFFKQFFVKKLNEGLFSGQLNDARRIPMGNKLNRIIKIVSYCVDRVIIIADADGGSVEDKKNRILSMIDPNYRDMIKIVLLDNEIEDWICYSIGIQTHGEKPSTVLKHRQQYKKNMLPRYANKIDCNSLQNCRSFTALLQSLKS